MMILHAKEYSIILIGRIVEVPRPRHVEDKAPEEEDCEGQEASADD